MPLTNYASTSAMPNIFADIEKQLLSHNAKQIVKDFDNQGKVTAIAFVVNVNGNDVAIRLPARFDRVEAIFREQGLKYKPEQPYRTAWATIRDWVRSQMALIDWEIVKMEEVFLPYAVNRDGKTFFEIIEQKQFLLEE